MNESPVFFFFFQAEDGIRDVAVTGVQTCALPICTPARYLTAHHDLLANRVSRIHIKERRGSFDAATHAEIDDLSMIGDECTIKPGARIVNSVLGAGCYVEERARIQDSVIWAHTRIG